MTAGTDSLRDRHGRTAAYLRVSLTPECGFRCLFCRPPGVQDRVAGRGKTLDADETLRLCRVFSRLGVKRFKLTGGEPFLHPDALRIARALKAMPGAESVTVTTNGSTLDRHAAGLASAGIDGVNVSLNAMDAKTFAAVTGSDMDVGRILDNIRRAHALGCRIKLNMVPIRGVNDADIVPLVAFALEVGVDVRFIELMPIGPGRGLRGLSREAVMSIIGDRFGRPEAVTERRGNGPAVYYRIGGHAPRIGHIAAVSRRFCEVCDRLRLTAEGFLRTCLCHDHGTDLAPALRDGADDAALAVRIRSAVAEKPAGHGFGGGQQANGGAVGTPMHRIGG